MSSDNGNKFRSEQTVGHFLRSQGGEMESAARKIKVQIEKRRGSRRLFRSSQVQLTAPDTLAARDDSQWVAKQQRHQWRSVDPVPIFRWIFYTFTVDDFIGTHLHIFNRFKDRVIFKLNLTIFKKFIWSSLKVHFSMKMNYVTILMEIDWSVDDQWSVDYLRIKRENLV